MIRGLVWVGISCFAAPFVCAVYLLVEWLQARRGRLSDAKSIYRRLS